MFAQIWNTLWFPSNPFNTAAAAAKSLQLCPTLCDPIDSSPPGSPIPGILKARNWSSRQHIKKQRHYFANKGPSSQSYGFSSSHVWISELDYKESWALKNWCFWTVVFEKTLESPLDFKEIQPVHSKGDHSWVFFGRTDAEAAHWTDLQDWSPLGWTGWISLKSRGLSTVFSNESTLCVRWPKYWSFSFSISPSNELMLKLLIGLISRTDLL